MLAMVGKLRNTARSFHATQQQHTCLIHKCRAFTRNSTSLSPVPAQLDSSSMYEIWLHRHKTAASRQFKLLRHQEVNLRETIATCRDTQPKYWTWASAVLAETSPVDQKKVHPALLAELIARHREAQDLLREVEEDAQQTLVHWSKVFSSTLYVAHTRTHAHVERYKRPF
eukprot:m.158538 g.158538  ORF g.158538 m.158538 type:complete len:170 (+) comp24761_c0_seq10:516-1025(+)